MVHRYKTTHERIELLTNFAQQWSAKAICEAGPDLMDEWLEIAKCGTCKIWGQRFEDLFPGPEVGTYCDNSGYGLPGMRMCYDVTEHQVRWEEIPAQYTGLRWEDQLNYLRLYLLPSFTAQLLSAYTSIAQYYSHQFSQQQSQETIDFFERLSSSKARLEIFQ